MKHWIEISLVSLLACCNIFATDDIVKLKSGRTIIGVISEETEDQLTVLTGSGRNFKIKKDQVANIIRGTDEPVGESSVANESQSDLSPAPSENRIVPPSLEPAPPQESPKKGFVAVHAGLGTALTGPSLGYWGAEVWWQTNEDPNEKFGLGLFFAGTTASTNVSGTIVTSGVKVLLVDLIGRNLWGTGLFGGARVGVNCRSASVTVGSTYYYLVGYSPAFGPVLGYEVEMGRFSFGLESSLISTLAGDISGGNYSVNLTGTNHLLLSSTLKFHF